MYTEADTAFAFLQIFCNIATIFYESCKIREILVDEISLYKV